MGQQIGFTGHEDDPEAGLTNMGGRIYDQAVGQFLQADPIVAEPASQGLNRYAYVNNSPLNFVDPSGFASQSAQGACYWPGCSGFGALASGVGAAGPVGLAGAGLGVGMGYVVASNIGVGGPAASSVAFSGSSTITGGGAGSGAGTSAGGGFDLGQALASPEAQAGSFGASVAGSLRNIAMMSEAGPGPTTTTAKVSMSSTSSMGATPKPGANPVAPVQEGKTIQEFERELAGGDARLACNGGGDVCLEILRRRQAEMQRRFEAGDFSDFEFVMGVPVVGGGPRSLLSRFHATQTARHFNFAKVKQFAEAMLRGKWDWARDPKIIVDKLGNVVSGHHRILAAERAGVQIPESAIHRLPSVTPRPVQPWPTVPP